MKKSELNPYDWTEETSLQTMKDATFYWMQKSYMLNIEKKALLALLDERSINISMRELLDMMNKVNCSEECERSAPSKKTSTRSSKRGTSSSK